MIVLLILVSASGVKVGKYKYIGFRLAILVIMATVTVLFSGCSNSSEKESSPKTSKISFTSNGDKSDASKPENNTFISVSKINSEIGAKSFAYKISSAFVSTDIKDGKLLEKYISSNAVDNILSNLIQRNNSDVLPSISFSPIVVTATTFRPGEAEVAVLGLSYTSGSGGITSRYKEILFTFDFNSTWKVKNYLISKVDGLAGNDDILDTSFLVYIDSFFTPGDEINSEEKKVVETSKVKNGTQLTQPAFAGE